MSDTPFCPLCRIDISGETPTDDGQITCPDCFSFFPLQWAIELEEFEQERDRRTREREQRVDADDG